METLLAAARLTGTHSPEDGRVTNVWGATGITEKGTGRFSFSAAEFVKASAGKGPGPPVPGEPFQGPRGEQTQLSPASLPPTSETRPGSCGRPSPQAPTLPPLTFT